MQKNQNNVLITSILYSLFFTCNSAPVILGEVDNLVTYLFAIITAAIITRNFKNFNSLKNSLIVLVFVIFCFIVTFLRSSSDIVTNTLLTFICFGAPLLFIPYSQINFNIVIKSILVQGILCIPFYATYEYGFGGFGGDGFEDGTLMTMSYRILPFILSSLIILVYQTKWNLFRINAAILALIYIAILFIIGSRGAQLSIVVFAILLFLLTSKDQKQKRRRIILSSCLVFFVLYGFAPVMYYIDTVLQTYNIDSLSITRIVNMLDYGRDLDTGRSALELLAWRDFLESPLFGKGIASFNNFSGGYPHNLFLQALGEGGVVFGILILIAFVTSLKDLFKYNINNPYILFLTFTFCAGVVRLFFSSTYWESQFFWAYISLLVNRRYIISTNS